MNLTHSDIAISYLANLAQTTGYPFVVNGSMSYQRVSNGSTVKLTTAVITYDPSSHFASERYTCVQPGSYNINIGSFGVGGNHGSLNIRKNGVYLYGWDDYTAAPFNVSTTMVTGDYLEFYASSYSPSGGFSIGSFTIKRTGV